MRDPAGPLIPLNGCKVTIFFGNRQTFPPIFIYFGNIYSSFAWMKKSLNSMKTLNSINYINLQKTLLCML